MFTMHLGAFLLELKRTSGGVFWLVLSRGLQHVAPAQIPLNFMSAQALISVLVNTKKSWYANYIFLAFSMLPFHVKLLLAC